MDLTRRVDIFVQSIGVLARGKHLLIYQVYQYHKSNLINYQSNSLKFKRKYDAALTHSFPMNSLSTSENSRKQKFSGVRERVHWERMG